ncbi:hypothetical protein D9M68_573300 [compost metagenome]
MGHAAGAPDRRERGRWRVRHVVRQGARRGPLRRRVQAHEPRGHLAQGRHPAGGGRRPRRVVVHPAQPERPPVRGLDDPHALPAERGGIHRAGPARLCDVALCRPSGRLQGAGRHGGIVGLDCRRRARRAHAPAERLRVSARRRACAAVDRHARRAGAQAGSADAGLQDLRRHRLRAREPPEPRDHRFAPGAAGHRGLGQVVPRRARSARRTGHRRRRGRAHRHPPVQGVDALAAGARLDPRVCRRARRNFGGRREAPDRRVPAQGAPVQLARERAPARHRQVRRTRRMGRAPARPVAAAGHGRLLGGADRARHRRARGALSHQRPHPHAAGDPRRERRGARQGRGHALAPGLVLRGLPAQHLDQGARRQPGARGHRLPRDGHGHLPRAQPHHHAHGRRRRAVAGAGVVLQAQARVREPGRRHLLPLGFARHSRGRGGGREHHLQDPLQRRGRDDRRPAGRRADHRAAHRAPGGGRRREAHRAGGRRPDALGRPQPAAARTRRPLCAERAPPRRHGRGAARAARLRGRVGADLRPGVRRREAPPPQEGRISARRAARVHQRRGVRRLRRLRRAIELHRPAAQAD